MKIQLVACLLTMTMVTFADVFVDFEKGNDRNNGEKATPLRTFSAAVNKAVPGDTVFLLPASKPVNTSLTVRNKKGLPDKPIVIDGMFNTLYGTVRIDEKSCQEVSPGLYLRKRSNPGVAMVLRYFMCFDGQMQRMERHLKWRNPQFKAVDALQPGEWTMQNNTDIYFKLPSGKAFNDVVVEEPKYISGVQLEGDCEYLIFRNLIVRNFWNDGYNIHNNCRNIRFENIAAVENSDDGISAHEDCQIFVKNMVSIGNGTGFCHIDRAECHHENIYIGDCSGRDILLNNKVNTLKNIVVDGSARGKLEFTGGQNSLDNCFFLNLRPGNGMEFKNSTMTVKDSWYCNYALPASGMPPELKPMKQEEISVRIKEQRDVLLAIFGDRIKLPQPAQSR